jgi:hypothetical protein
MQTGRQGNENEKLYFNGKLSAPICILIALMMEAARTSERLVNLYQTTRRYNPEDSQLPVYQNPSNTRVEAK